MPTSLLAFEQRLPITPSYNPHKGFLPYASDGAPEGLRMAEETPRWVSKARGLPMVDIEGDSSSRPVGDNSST